MKIKFLFLILSLLIIISIILYTCYKCEIFKNETYYRILQIIIAIIGVFLTFLILTVSTGFMCSSFDLACEPTQTTITTTQTTIPPPPTITTTQTTIPPPPTLTTTQTTVLPKITTTVPTTIVTTTFPTTTITIPPINKTDITPILVPYLAGSNSGISADLGKPVDMNMIYNRGSQSYDILFNNSTVIIWKFSGTTGDTAFIFSDGRHLITSTANLNLAGKDTLENELDEILDLKGTIITISDTEKENAIDHATYYSTDSGVFHRIKYSFGADFDNIVVKVPVWNLKEARLSVEGGDVSHCCGTEAPGQGYMIDGIMITSCCGHPCDEGGCDRCQYNQCMVAPADIVAKLSSGDRLITALWIWNKHNLIIETITDSTDKKLVLHGPNSQPWIEETTKSLSKENMVSYIHTEITTY